MPDDAITIATSRAIPAFLHAALARIHARDPATQAVFWIVLSCILFTTLHLELRFLMHEVHALQAAFYRNLAAWLFILPLLRGVSKQALLNVSHRTHLLRSLVGVGGMSTMFLSFQMLPLAQAVSFSFVAPLFATAGAALVLGETVRIRRWTAILAGFAGTLVMLRPWHEGSIHPGMIAALVSALFVAASTLIIKRMAGRDPLRVNLFYMGIYMIPLSLLLALPVWQPLSLQGYALVVLIGLTATLSQSCMQHAFSLADASALMPYDFIRLPLAAVFGYAFFGETLDGWTLAGALIILCSSAYVAWRERRQKLRLRTVETLPS